MSSVYKMPAVEPGRAVIWHHDGNKDLPYPAIVTRVGENSVYLSVIDAANLNFSIKDGVRHVGDPRIMPAELREMGTWDFTERDKQIDLLLAEFLGKPEKKKV